MVNFDVVTFGSGVIDVFTENKVGEKNGMLNLKVGEKYLIDNLQFDIGGGGTNVAVAFSRFGFKTGCICGVGCDSNGKEILKLLKRERVKFLGKAGGGQTGYSIIINSEKKNRALLTYKGENDEVELKDIKKFRARWLYYSSLLGKSFESQKKLVKQLKKENVKIAFNPSSYLIKAFDIRELLEVVDVLILNKEEGKMLCKRYGKSGNLLKALYGLGPKVVVVTDRDNLVRCFDGKKQYSVMPNKKVAVVERTGAGDAFASGFVGGMISGFPIEKCLMLGIEEGESVLGYFGAKNNLIKRNLSKEQNG